MGCREVRERGRRASTNRLVCNFFSLKNSVTINATASARKKKTNHPWNRGFEFGMHVHWWMEHLECSLQPSPPGCFTKKLSEARGNGIGFVTTG